MKVTNRHTAALTLPGGERLEPGEVGEAKRGHVTDAWLAAGLLEEIADAVPVADASSTDPVENTYKRSRKP